MSQLHTHAILAQFLIDEEHDLADSHSQPIASSSVPQIWPSSNPVYVKMEDAGDDASSSWGFMDYDNEHNNNTTTPTGPTMTSLNCIPGGLSQISLPGSSRSPSPDMMALPGGFNFTSPSAQKPVSAIPAHLRPRGGDNNATTATASTITLNPSSLVSPPVVSSPQQQTLPVQKSNGTSKKANSNSAPTAVEEQQQQQQPHPYSISPTNTTALFTRASSVSSTSSGAPSKKSRAPPSGPISTKDFVPPDVSGLSKRDARLVKNRAAAFLSRQRKREEFEGLEARVEVLEADNARLYKELESYRSGSSSGMPGLSQASAPPSSSAVVAAGPSQTPAALQAELVGLRRQLVARDQELAKLHSRMQGLNSEANTERERAAMMETEVQELKRQLAMKKESQDDGSDSDSEDAQSSVGDVASGKKDLKSAGSMAFMVLLFSLSSLLTSAESSSSSSAKPPVSSERVRRPGMHHRDSSRTYIDLPQQSFSSGLSYDSFLSTSDASMMLSPSFGFDEDNLLGASSSFAGLAAANNNINNGARPQQPQPKQQETVGINAADALQRATAEAISGVKSISPEEFEFDFTVPTSSSSSSSAGGFTFPAKPAEKGKKIKVVVKSALPLNLNLDALSTSSRKTSVASSTSSTETAAVANNNNNRLKLDDEDLFGSASGFGYGIDPTLSAMEDFSGLWSTSVSTFGGSNSPTTSSLLSPTMSNASSEGRKRKRVVVEINPRSSRRRLGEDDAMDQWDVKFSEDDDLTAFDEDVQMRL